MLSTGKLSAGLASTAALTRLASTAALTLERPCTAQREQGRCPLTVLQPRPGLEGTSGQTGAGQDSTAGATGAAAAAEASGGGGGARGPNGAAPHASSSGDDAAPRLEPGGGGERRATSGVAISEAAEALGEGDGHERAAGAPISLKVGGQGGLLGQARGQPKV